MNHRVLDECVNAVLGSDKFIASDVARICSFWSHVMRSSFYVASDLMSFWSHLPILDAENVCTWTGTDCIFTDTFKLNPSCGSHTEGAAGDTWIHRQFWLGLQEKAVQLLKREFQAPTEDAGLSTTFLSSSWSSWLLTDWDEAQEKRQVWHVLRSAGTVSVVPMEY